MNRRLFADARRRPSGLLVAERRLLAVWVGGMLAVGYLVVPVVFHMLDDRVLAGALAGEMFRYTNGVGLVCGALLIASALVSSGLAGLRTWRSIVIAIMQAIAATILFVLKPQMAALKAVAAAAGAELAPAFGRLHGLSSALYLLASVLGVVLVASGPLGRDR